MTPAQSIAQRSITSVSWNVVSNIAAIAIGFVRTVLLARWLPVEVFGVYALASSIVTLGQVVADFAMGEAFLHRAPETEDEDHAAAIHFTLKTIFTFAWAVVMSAGALTLSTGQVQLALLVRIAAASGITLTHIPNLILVRRIMHRRLALMRLCDVLLSTVLSLGLAYQGITLWALLASDLVSLFVSVALLYFWRPVWRPRFAWSPKTVRYYLRFGCSTTLAIFLYHALDRLDDLWTGIFLGETSLGFYSRAYRFASYPRQLIADPIGLVAMGTYAELKDDRKRLSEAFFLTNAFLVRSGFFLAALIALVAPEFIRIALGERWLPMLNAFRLMLVFTLFDPIQRVAPSLLGAMGNPQLVVRIRSVQLAVLLAGLFLLGPSLDIAGVALAVDMMLVTGIAILLYKARAYVDFSIVRLFAAPTVALIVSYFASQRLGTLSGVLSADWEIAIAKSLAFTVIYFAVLLTLEFRQLRRISSILISYVPFAKREIELE